MMARTPIGEISGTNRIVDALRERIVLGGWLPGEELPTFTTLGEEYEVSKDMIDRAVRILADEGLIQRRGSGRPAVVLKPGQEEQAIRALRQVAHWTGKLVKAHGETAALRAKLDEAILAAAAAGVASAEIARHTQPMSVIHRLDRHAIERLVTKAREATP